MRLTAKVLFVAVSAALLVACSDFKEENVSAGLSVDSTELSFSSTASSQSMSVSSGNRWDISSMPEWVSVQSITTNSLYQWAVSFSVSENLNYNREGTIVFKSTAEMAKVAVKQEGMKGEAPVDLGLSVKWAAYNVGANKPEEFGYYFAWGETTPKSDYDWSTYKWCTSYSNMTKYNTNSSYGAVDNKTQLELSDDAARANWGGYWRMPTNAEWTELRNNCTWIWTTRNGVYGCEVMSKKNGNSIFLPAAGGFWGGGAPWSAESIGYYWSSTMYTGRQDSAYILFFDLDEVDTNGYARLYGFSVRPVTE